MKLTDLLTGDKLGVLQQLIASLLLLTPRVVLVVSAIGVGMVCMRLFIVWWQLRRETVMLELTPPLSEDKSPLATAWLFSVLHGLQETRPLLHQLLGLQVVISLEMMSTRQEGIRFMVRCPEAYWRTLRRTIEAYAKGVRVRRVDDYLPSTLKGNHTEVCEFRQSSYFAYPLQKSDQLAQYDPVSYLAGAMAGLAGGDVVSIQFVITPAAASKARSILDKLLHNEERLRDLGKHRKSSMLAYLMASALFSVLESVGDLTHGPSAANKKHYDYQQRQRTTGYTKPARTMSALEQHLADAVHEKLSQPLFKVNIRSLVVARTRQGRRRRSNEVRQALAPFSTSRQSLKSKRRLLSGLDNGYRLASFRYRLPSVFPSGGLILSTGELAGLYHFPHHQAGVDEAVRLLNKTLPAPLALKQHAANRSFDVVLGRNRHHGKTTHLGLTEGERQRHVYILGGTGNGKTTMLLYAIIQDMRTGKGVAVVDPHGDLAEAVLRYIPEERIDDVIYFNPSDLSHPIGLNLLELPKNLVGDERLAAEDFVTEAVISIMRKTFSKDDAGGHRIEYIMRNTIHTALATESPTIFTIFDLLTNPKYRKRVLISLQDQKLRNFWANELGKAGDFQRVKMASGVTSKIGRFQFSASTLRVMGQAESTIDFDDILDGKILICNFAKGLIGEDTAELFGVSTLAMLQLAAYRRVRRKQSERKQFYLYVDEFQNFATKSFEQLLSEARKYQVFLTIAEQSTTQQERRLVENILSNVGTVVCFRTGSPADEQLLLPRFQPYVMEGEIMHLPSYHFYAKLSALKPQEPVSGETIPLEDAGSADIAQKAIVQSRKNYAGNSAQPSYENVDKAASVMYVSDGLSKKSAARPERHILR